MMPWRWWVGWMAVWELVGLAAVLTFLWTLFRGGDRERPTPHEANGMP
jgi:hypothetical protein